MMNQVLTQGCTSCTCVIGGERTPTTQTHKQWCKEATQSTLTPPPVFVALGTIADFDLRNLAPTRPLIAQDDNHPPPRGQCTLIVLHRQSPTRSRQTMTPRVRALVGQGDAGRASLLWPPALCILASHLAPQASLLVTLTEQYIKVAVSPSPTPLLQLLSSTHDLREWPLSSLTCGKARRLPVRPYPPCAPASPAAPPIVAPPTVDPPTTHLCSITAPQTSMPPTVAGPLCTLPAALPKTCRAARRPPSPRSPTPRTGPSAPASGELLCH